ncbi:nickel transporter [ANME-1 cluster archaeon GoMg4]|nr:nickel transporter [ANME-1 cluster archaeon GoMg4]
MIFPSDSEATVWDVTPEDYIAELGDTKTVYIMWGHPYEHISFNMASTPEVSVRKPDGAVLPLTTTQITVDGMDEDGNLGTFVAYKASFTVDQMGDSVVFVRYEDEDEKLTDYVKAIIHCGVEAWEGWDAEIGQKAEIVPFTRPYGLEEGFVFTGTALYDGNALSDKIVEVEMYHTMDLGKEVVETAETMFAYDPPMMFTRVTKTNAAGEFAYTLDEQGIWFVGVYGPEVGGLTQRSVFIIPVLDAFPPKDEAEAAAPVGLEDLKSRVKSLEDKVATLKAPAGEGLPGFGVIAAIAGLLIVVYIVKRRKR